MDRQRCDEKEMKRQIEQWRVTGLDKTAFSKEEGAVSYTGINSLAKAPTGQVAQ